MSLDEIKALKIPAAKDAALFLWATVPMLPQALETMVAWDFAYKSHFIWAKDKLGLGFWARNRHELLLIGTRGRIPAPAPGTQFSSVIEAPRGRHSEKPAVVRQMIAAMFPNVPKLEMFARGERVAEFDVWGNEVATSAIEGSNPLEFLERFAEQQANSTSRSDTGGESTQRNDQTEDSNT
jgi:N6-adenosine-specific RNA methylase IME4